MLLPIALIFISRLVYEVAAEDCIVPHISHGDIEEQVQGPEKYNWWKVRWERKITNKKIPVGSIPSNSAVLFLVCQQDNLVPEQSISRFHVTCSGGKWSRDLSCLKNECSIPYISNGNIEEKVHEPEKYKWWKLRWEKKITYKKVPVGSIPSNSATLFLVCQRDHLVPGQSVSRIQIYCLGEKWSRDLVCLKTICPDPGPVPNGKAETAGLIGNVFNVGASIEYSCQRLHHLSGEKSISCIANGTWSAKKPECIKLDFCENPPIPKAGFVTYLRPLKTNAARRSAISESKLPHLFRAAHLHSGPEAPIPANEQMSKTPESMSMALPPGLHRVGTIARYDCESRYYKLIGSTARRCQLNGEWSGRPPMCMPVCGLSDSQRSPFIANGNVTNIGQWPWQVRITRYLEDYKRWSFTCGASLLNEIWVITAAHCVTYSGKTLIRDPDKFKVYMGKYYKDDSKDDEYVQVRKVREIHIHPNYDPAMVDADIALIQLDSPVELNTRVQPICLPTEETTRYNLVEGNKGVVTGWGKNEKGTNPEILQQAVLPVVSHANCVKGYEVSGHHYTVTDNMFCAGYADGRSDSCSGDSGSPMVFIDSTSKERRWVLEGIVSWGGPDGCGQPNQYGVYTTVSKFLDWIHLYF